MWRKGKSKTAARVKRTAIPVRARRKDGARRGPRSRELSLGLDGVGLIRLQEALIRGLPLSTLERFESASGLSKAVILNVIRLPVRTLARRKKKDRLSFEESERLYRLATVFRRAVEFYQGKPDVARRWFESPCLALGNQTPLEMTKTEVGAQEVFDLIGRLEHGVFS